MVLLSGIDCEAGSAMARMLIDEAAAASGVFSMDFEPIGASGDYDGMPKANPTLGEESSGKSANSARNRLFSTGSGCETENISIGSSSLKSSDPSEALEFLSASSFPIKIEDDLSSISTSTQSRPVPLNSKFVESLQGFELPPSCYFGGKRGNGSVGLGTHVVGLSPSPYANFYQKHSMTRLRGKNYSRSLLTNASVKNENPDAMTCLRVLVEAQAE